MLVDRNALIALSQIAAKSTTKQTPDIKLELTPEGVIIAGRSHSCNFEGKVPRIDLGITEQEQTAVLVPAAIVKGLVQKFNSFEAEGIEVTSGDTPEVTLTCGKSSYTVEGVQLSLPGEVQSDATDEISYSSSVDEILYSSSVDEIKDLIGTVRYAFKQATDGSVLENLLLCIGDGSLDGFGTDAHRLAWHSSLLVDKKIEKMAMLLPQDLVDVLNSSLTGLSLDTEVLICCRQIPGQSYVRFEIPAINVKIAGYSGYDPLTSYPKVRTFFPEEPPEIYGVLPKKEMLNALRLVQVFAAKSNNTFALSANESHLVLKCKCADVGAIEERIEWEDIKGLEGAIFSNVQYFIDIIQSIKYPSVFLSFKPLQEGERPTPIYIYENPREADPSKHILMPVQSHDD
jgi:DNA polymerase III sliding clamp (beta) subunit (PCNA family)